jgi:hypothetical protein
MKNFAKFFGIIALVAIMVLSMAACDPEGKVDNASGIDTLNLSGRVYLQEQENYSDFGQSVAIISSNGRTGSVTNGNLSYSIGTPTSLWQLNSNSFGLSSNYDVSLSATVRGYRLSGLSLVNADGYIRKEEFTRINSLNIHDESVSYVYVENDVTLNGTGGTQTNGNTTNIYRNFNLALKAGWNAIYKKREYSGTNTNGSLTIIITETVSLKNPALRWVLSDYIPTPSIPPTSSTPLSSGSWASGTLSAETSQVWYWISVTSGQQYNIWVDDRDQGSGSETGDVKIRAYYSNGTGIWDDSSFGIWNNPESFTASSTGTVYIRVAPKGNDSYFYGTYRIVYSTDTERPQ